MRRESNTNAAIACCGAALACLVPVALHQTGVLGHLPDPPGALFDSDKITGSKDAHPLGIPDGLLGLASFGTTMALLIATRTRKKRPLLRAGLKAKLAIDASMASTNSIKQVVKFRRLCSWCTGTALATAGMVYFARRGAR